VLLQHHEHGNEMFLERKFLSYLEKRTGFLSVLVGKYDVETMINFTLKVTDHGGVNSVNTTNESVVNLGYLCQLGSFSDNSICYYRCSIGGTDNSNGSQEMTGQ
jgi:hypothetical protein